MSTPFRREPVRIVVPATSANLGPAFDTAGLALELFDEMVGMITDDPGVRVELTGEGATGLPRDESHLVVRAMAAGFESLGARPEGFLLRCTNSIPHGRGLGSSAAAIVSGLALARAMVSDGPERMSDLDLFQLALSFEPHPDNLAAAIWGGLTIAWLDEFGRGEAVRVDVDPRVNAVVLVPATQLSTTSARAMLPASVQLTDAAANIARTALLVHSLARDPSHLFAATEDRLHQDARRSGFPDSLAMVERLRHVGVPAVISGAGPSVLAFAGQDPDELIDDIASGGNWRILRLAIATAGVHEVALEV